MPTETFTSSYDPNEPSVTVTARMFIGSNEIANITKTFTESDFPPIEVDPCIIKIFGSANNTPAYTNHESEDSVFLFTGDISGAPGDITDEGYINTTEDELRVGFQTYLNSTDDRHGVQRSSYLNANTRGFVVLDIESPRNMVSLGDLGGFGQFGTREEEIEWFTQGVIKRINVIREFLPNAKIGVWRFAEGSNGAIQDRLQAHIDESVFAANVSYNGKTLYQTIDMFVSVLYQYFAEDGPDPEPIVYNRIVNGDRVDQALQVRDGIYNSFPLVQQKPTLALIAHQYEGGSRANQSATIPNSAEMTFAINRGLTNKFMIWYALPQEMGSNPNNPTSFESHKQDLLNNINTCEEPITFEPNRNPMYVSPYASNLDQTVFGTGPSVNDPIWRKTPLTSAEDSAFADETQNGRIKYTRQHRRALASGFRRLSMNQIGGLTNFNDDAVNPTTDPARIFPSNPFSSLLNPFAPDYSVIHNGDMNGTFLSDFGTPLTSPNLWLNTPYTPTGEPNTDIFAPVGDQVKAWKAATDRIKDEADALGIPQEELILQCYTGWRPVYASFDETTLEPSFGEYDRVSLIHDIDAERSPRVTFWDNGWWDPEIEGIKSLGFNAISFDASSSVWADGGNSDTIIKQVYEYGLPVVFEAVPLTDNGQTGELKKFIPFGVTETDDVFDGRPDQRYEVAAYWGLFPQFFTSENVRDRFPFGDSGNRMIDYLYFNPETSEVHVVFDRQQLQNTILGYNMTYEEIKQEMIVAWQHGFVVSLQNAPGDEFGDDEDIRQFVIDISNGVATDSDGNLITRPTDPTEFYSTAATPGG
jgi:hypothetical protein